MPPKSNLKANKMKYAKNNTLMKDYSTLIGNENMKIDTMKNKLDSIKDMKIYKI